MIQLVDTHCHIQTIEYELDGDDPIRARWLEANKRDVTKIISDARNNGVTKLLCVGTTLSDSQTAVDFVSNQPDCWATIGLHPHEASVYVDNEEALEKFKDLVDKPKVVAIGEAGLDYHYNHSPPGDQKKLLKFQLDLALEYGLPLVFHVREAFDDFWEIIDKYPSMQGVIHSFSDSRKELDRILARNFYVGLNGIMTFTKESEQLEAAKAIPLDKLLLETDSPYLTPVPFRGKIGEPKYVRTIADFLANLRGESVEALASQTTQNAIKLFKL